MEYRLFKTEDHGIEEQAWGRIRELAIFPWDAPAEDGNFIWRISTWTVEEEEAEMPFFPGYDRVLTVVEGDVILTHEGERAAKVKEREQDAFDGGVGTKSFGRVTGYDLTLKKGNQGILEWVKAETHGKVLTPAGLPTSQNSTWCFYCVEGYGVLHRGEDSLMVRQGELLVMEFDEEEPGRVSILGDGELIWTQIYRGDEDGPVDIPHAPGTMDDFLICIKLANSNFRGGKRVFKSLRNIWFDEALQKALRRVEKFYFTFIVGFLGFTVSALVAWEVGGQVAVLPAILIWLLIHVLFVGPLIYFVFVPKPVRAHMKDIDALTPYERKVYEKQKSENPRLERLLKKYTITGRNKYID